MAEMYARRLSKLVPLLDEVSEAERRSSLPEWVEDGEIAFPVQEITIAGNLKEMFQGIEAVGADVYNYGAKTVGSVLVNRMKIAGS